FNGQIIMIHKFRTMYPYSEFLQEYIYEHNKLDTTGKFKDDFRITSWGRLMRKMWLDELPQLYDWLQGDLKIFGVRALSQHYFSLYPEEVQKMRVQQKPGLVPPIYADRPKSFDDVVESERRYLTKKIKYPLMTDVTYFIKAFYNIVFKGVRSR
ncbi:MAG: sugar transferase, partial [Chlorobiales bacterium]|nr:sugar transferase [Chlorobiales bacterium]